VQVRSPLSDGQAVQLGLAVQEGSGMGRPAGKVALVTGTASGVGAAAGVAPWMPEAEDIPRARLCLASNKAHGIISVALAAAPGRYGV
jgi:hypothetical protein